MSSTGGVVDVRAAHPADVGGDGGDRLKSLIPGSVDRLGRELKRTTASSRKRRAHCLGNSPSRSARSASSSNSGGDSSRPDSRSRGAMGVKSVLWVFKSASQADFVNRRGCESRATSGSNTHSCRSTGRRSRQESQAYYRSISAP